MSYGEHTGISHLSCFWWCIASTAGTMLYRYGIDILIATPGRLLDLMNQGHIDLQTDRMFVLDEADRMLDMGFIHDVKRVIAKLPA